MMTCSPILYMRMCGLLHWLGCTYSYISFGCRSSVVWCCLCVFSKPDFRILVSEFSDMK
jgi:hypothetical protein